MFYEIVNVPSENLGTIFLRDAKTKKGKPTAKKAGKLFPPINGAL